MQANLTVLEILQNIAGTPDTGNSIFNNGTLPVLLQEFQKTRRVAGVCDAIMDTVRDLEGTSALTGAISDMRQKCDDDMLDLQQRICKEAADDFGDAGRYTFFRLDEGTQAALTPIVAGDYCLREALKMKAAQSQTGQSPPQ